MIRSQDRSCRFYLLEKSIEPMAAVIQARQHTSVSQPSLPLASGSPVTAQYLPGISLMRPRDSPAAIHVGRVGRQFHRRRNPMHGGKSSGYAGKTPPVNPTYLAEILHLLGCSVRHFPRLGDHTPQNQIQSPKHKNRYQQRLEQEHHDQLHDIFCGLIGFLL